MYLLLLNYCRPYPLTAKNPNLYYYPLQILWLKDKELWKLKVMFYILTSKIGRFYLIIIELILPPRRFRNSGLCTSLIKTTQLKRSAYLFLVFKRNLEWFRSIYRTLTRFWPLLTPLGIPWLSLLFCLIGRKMAKQTVTAHFSQTQEAFLDPKGQKKPSEWARSAS